MLSSNSAEIAGAILNFGNGSLTITESTLSSNSAPNFAGGAIVNNGAASLTIARSTFSSNSARNEGGAIFNSSTAALTITDSMFSSNTTTRTDGGGIAHFGSGALTITGSTFSGNTARRNGGGIYSSAQPTIRHSTIVLNRADSDGDGSGLGGGLYLDSGSMATLENTIVAGNVRGAAPGGTSSDIEGDVQVASNSSYNLIGDPATAGGLVHGTNGNIVGDGSGNPLDINTVLDTTLADNGGPTMTHALVAGSPAINAGDPNFAPPPEFDQRGAPFVRVFGGRIDIGAFEVQTATLQYMVEELYESGSLTRGQAFMLEVHLRLIDPDSRAGTLLANVHLTNFMRQVGRFVQLHVLSGVEGRMLLDAARALRSSFPSRPPSPVIDLAFLQTGDWLGRDGELSDPLEAARDRARGLAAKTKR
jgi:predicted outer membrane repeat protein